MQIKSTTEHVFTHQIDKDQKRENTLGVSVTPGL